MVENFEVINNNKNNLFDISNNHVLKHIKEKDTSARTHN